MKSRAAPLQSKAVMSGEEQADHGLLGVWPELLLKRARVGLENVPLLCTDLFRVPEEQPLKSMGTASSQAPGATRAVTAMAGLPALWQQQMALPPPLLQL